MHDLFGGKDALVREDDPEPLVPEPGMLRAGAAGLLAPEEGVERPPPNRVPVPAVARMSSDVGVGGGILRHVGQTLARSLQRVAPYVGFLTEPAAPAVPTVSAASERVSDPILRKYLETSGLRPVDLDGSPELRPFLGRLTLLLQTLVSPEDGPQSVHLVIPST